MSKFFVAEPLPTPRAARKIASTICCSCPRLRLRASCPKVAIEEVILERCAHFQVGGVISHIADLGSYAVASWRPRARSSNLGPAES